MWRSLCRGHFSPSRKIHPQFCSQFSQEAEQEAHGVIVLPAANHASALVQSPAPRQPARVTCSCLGPAEQGEVMGLHCSQGKHHLQGPKLLHAHCSPAALHLSPIPTVCSNTPACAPYAENTNASPFAWLFPMLFLSL